MQLKSVSVFLKNIKNYSRDESKTIYKTSFINNSTYLESDDILPIFSQRRNDNTFLTKIDEIIKFMRTKITCISSKKHKE